MEITFNFDDKKVQKKLNELATGLKDFRTPLGQAGEDLVNFFDKDVFDGQGEPAGERWRALSARTLQMRAARAGYYKNTPEATNKILVWTGRLHRGFESMVKTLSLTIKNNVEYFRYHQLGGGVPKRAMLTINSRVIEKVMNKINEYIVKLIL